MGETWTVEDHLRGRPPTVVALYERMVRTLEGCGPIRVSVTKTAIGFAGTRRGFAGAKPKDRWLDGFFDLQRPVEDARIRRVSPYTQRLFVHQFRLRSDDGFDEEFASWLREAYAVGRGDHLGR